ncbi:hypothetical protein Tco_0854623 [Tanacetum coccineum]
MGDSLKYPPGFTPMDEKDKISHNEGEKHSHNNVDVTSAPRENINVEVIANQNSLKNKERGNESIASGHFKQSECHKTGGSILSLLGVYYVMWWLLWWYRNKKIFEGKSLIKAIKVQQEFAAMVAIGTVHVTEAAALATKKVVQKYGT